MGKRDVNIMNMMNGKCIDSAYRTATPLIMYDCYGWFNNAGQFFFRPGAMRMTIQLHGKNLCLDAYGRTAGATVGLWDCHGEDNQQWCYNPVSMTLRPLFNLNLCLNIKNADGSNEASLRLWHCNSGKNHILCCTNLVFIQISWISCCKSL